MADPVKEIVRISQPPLQTPTNTYLCKYKNSKRKSHVILCYCHETHFKAMLWLSLWIPSNINYKPRKIRYGPLIKLKIMMDIEPIQARIIIMYNMSITRGNRECYTKIIWGSAYIHSICLYFSLKTSWIVSCIMVVSQAITHWKYNLPDNRFVTI
jgi:hypothetical protein